MFDLGSIFVRIKAKTEEFDKGLAEVKNGADTAGKNVEGLRSRTEKLGQGMLAMGAMGAAGLYAVKSGIDNAIGAANKFDAAMIGLSSIARAFGSDADKAKAAAQRLSDDGLMSVADSAVGLKNLLAAGFSLPEAISLMERFKDSAAFARQGSLSFGEAIKGATEGIKNGNSILVDNAGVTKNLSMMLEEAGYSAQDLMKASSDAGVRQAIYNGIIKETNAQVGDAALYADTYAGAQARAAAATEKTNKEIGKALQPVLQKLLDTVTPVIEKIGEFAKEHPKLVAAIGIGLAVFFGLFAIIGAIGAVVVVLVTAFGATAAIIVGAVVAAIAILVGAAVWVLLNWEKVTQFFSELPGKIGGFFSELWNTIVSWLGNVVSSSLELAGKALDAIVSFMAKLPGEAAYWFGFMIGTILRFFIELPGNLIGAAAAILSFIVDLFRSVRDNGVWWISNLINAVVDFFRNLPGRIAGFATAMWNTARSLSQTIYDAFIDAIKWLPDRMWEILTQVVNRIKDFAGKVLNAAKDLGGKIWQGFKDGLGIHSPSYLEKAMMAIQDRGETTMDAMKKQIGGLNSFATRARTIAGDMAVGGFDMSLQPSYASSFNPSVGGPVQPMTVVHVDMAGANITSPQVADEMGEAMGDAIIRKLGNTVRV